MIVSGGSIIGKTFSQELYTTHVEIKHPRIRGERPVHNLYLRTKRRTAGSCGMVGLAPRRRPSLPRVPLPRQGPVVGFNFWVRFVLGFNFWRALFWTSIFGRAPFLDFNFLSRFVFELQLLIALCF